MERYWYCLGLVALLCLGVECANWGGVNSYFLHTLSDSDREEALFSLKGAGVKVIRIFINHVDKGNKGSSSVGVADLEDVAVGNYNDDVLYMIDKLMYEAYQYGIKLTIAMHDRYSLGCWQKDAYVSTYNLPNGYPGCNTKVNQPIAFYVDDNIQAAFDRRLVHILTHKNSYFNNRAWGNITEAIFAFEPENEAQGWLNQNDWNWACRRSKTMRPLIQRPILIATGGGVTFETSTVLNQFQCSTIDVVTLHNYNANYNYIVASLQSANQKAHQYGKRILVEEFGTQGDDQQKASGLSSQIDAINSQNVPWFPWEFVKPQTNDYEFYTGGATWKDVNCKSQYSLTQQGGFDWPEINGTSPGGGKSDWQFCSNNSQCTNGCCSNKYSSDGCLKCTPGGC